MKSYWEQKRDDSLIFAWSAPSHYLNQCWNIVNSNLRNKLQGNLGGIQTFSFKEIHVKMSSAKLRQFCLGLNMLMLSVILTHTHCIRDVARMSIVEVNSLRPGAAYMRQWSGSSLVREMACRLFGAKPLPEPKLTYCQFDPRNKLQWTLNPGSIISIQENAFEKVVCQNGGHFVQEEIS